MEDIGSDPEDSFSERLFEELETVAMATESLSPNNTMHAFLVILLENALQKKEKYIFVAQNR